MAFFKKKKNNTTKGHIKSGTAGTSNEISFSVLDAASSSLDEKNKSKKKHGLGRISLFTLPGKTDKDIAATPEREKGLLLQSGEFARAENQSMNSVAIENEIKRRKMKRKVRNTGAAVTVLILFGLFIGSVAHYFYTDYQNNQTYEGILNNSLEHVMKVDETLSLMDASFANLLSDASIEDMKTVLEQEQACRSELEEAAILATNAAENFTAAEEIEIAAQAQNAIAARETMLDLGLSIVNHTLEAHDQILNMQNAWLSLLEADDIIKEAVSGLGNLEGNSVSGAQSKFDQAEELLYKAESCYKQVEQHYPSLDLSLYYDYIDLRLSSLSHISASLDAVAVEDTTTAATEMAFYNELDSQAIAIAESLPTNPAQPIKDALHAQLVPLSEEYAEACSQAAKADEVLRNYIYSKSL